MPAHTTDNRENKPWWEERSQLLVAVLVIVAISAMSLVGFGFFFIPIILGAAFIGLFVWVLRRFDFRNNLSSQRPGLSDRYADGQPYGRTTTHEEDEPYRELDERPPARSVDDDIGRHAP